MRSWGSEGITRAIGEGGGPAPFATPPAATVARPAPLPLIETPLAPETVGAPAPVEVAAEPVAIVAVEPAIPEPNNVGVPALTPVQAAAQADASRSLLSGAEVKVELAAASAAPVLETGAAKGDAASAVAPVEAKFAPVVYAEFRVPQGVTFDAAKLDDKLLRHLRPYGVPQEVAQTLVDNLVEEIGRAVGEARGESRRHYQALIAGWKKATREDPKLRNRLETALQNGKLLIQTTAGAADADAILRQIDDSGNGMGSFPPFVRWVDSLGDRLNVFDEGAVGARAPPPATKTGRGWYDNPPS